MPLLAATGPVLESYTEPPPDPLDVRFFDFDSETGPSVSLTEYSGNAATKISATGTTSAKHIAADDGLFIETSGSLARFEDCDIELPSKALGNTPKVYLRCTVRPDYTSQRRLGAVTGSINGPMTDGEVSYCEIIAAQDGLNGGSGSVHHNWFRGPDVAWVQGRPPLSPYVPGQGVGVSYRSTYLDLAEVQAINQFPLTGATLALGDRIRVIAGNALRVFEAVVAGTLGGEMTGAGVQAGNAPTWPFAAWDTLASGNTTQPFTSGTAHLVCLGPTAHVDAMQWVGGGRCDVYTNRMDDAGNSPLFIQSASSTQTMPTQAIHAWDNILNGSNSKWIGANLVGPKDPNYVANILPGGYIRSGGSWVVNPVSPGKTRPWALGFWDNWFGPLSNGTTWPTALPVADRSVTYDRAIYVKTVAKWKACVAAQFGWATDDPRLDQAWMGDLDWPSQSLTINQTVMNNRWGGGVIGQPFDGACDARTFIVWSNNRHYGGPNDGQLIHPAFFVGANFDNDGYFIGT